MGMLYWQKGDTQKALTLFKNPLRTNPNDNGGVRYFMLGILEGMTEENFNSRFDKGGFMDNEVGEWFDENHTKYKKIFEK